MPGPTLTQKQMDLFTNIASAFTPSAPLTSQALFAGRTDQIASLVGALTEPGLHAVLFGERGVGKTSLANVVSAMARGFGFTVISTACDPSDTFSSIWQRLLSQVPFEIRRQGMGFDAESTGTKLTAADLVLAGSPKAAGLSTQLQRVGLSGLIVLDEFDQVRDPATREDMAALLKILSDTYHKLTVLVVGVATDVTTLIGSHASVERCLRQVLLPRMSAGELGEIISKGAQVAGVQFAPEVADKIVKLSQGFPHYTHLLAKHAASSAATANRSEIEAADLDTGIERAIDHANATIRDAYRKATISVNEALYEDVLLAAALVPCDDDGAFRAKDLVEPISIILKRKMSLQSFFPHLGKLCLPERASILERLGSRRPFRYRFSNPLMKPYVLMTGAKAGHTV